MDTWVDPFQPEPLQYADDCPSLPSTRPHGFPHIIDINSYMHIETDPEKLTCADGVATFLWNWDKEQFRRFFDLTEQTVHIYLGAPDGVVNDMVIHRAGKKVSAGYRVKERPGIPKRDFLVAFIVQEDGAWKPAEWNSLGSEGYERDQILDLGRTFTEMLLLYKLWITRDPSTSKIRVIR